MFIGYNPNPVRSDPVGDCAVRAVAKALDITWEDAYAKLSASGFLMGDILNSDAVLAAVLRSNGFRRGTVDNDCPDCYTVADFADDNKEGIYVVKSDNHVATIIDGNLFDSWDSSNRVPLWYWEKHNERNV